MKVLLIEDDKKISKAVKLGLEQERFIVEAVFDGEEGYNYASLGDYDVILLDLMLPKMDGMEVCKKLRTKNIATPILMLTARSDIEDRIKGLNIGADDYLPKPFNFEELLARIKAVIRRPSKLIDELLECGTLVLDLTSNSVKVGGKEISLSKKEYSLLEYLLRNKNRICSKEELLDKVWGYESDALPNTVEVYIAYLRNKLEKPFDNKKFIKTVRGFGYKIECN